MKAFGLMMLPLSVLPFVAVRGDVIREHDAYLISRAGRVPIGTAVGAQLPSHAPAPALDAPVHPAIPLGAGATVTLGTRDGSILVELNRAATAQGRRILIDADGDGAADITVGAAPAGVKIVACQTSVAALASAGSGRRADGGTAVHLPAGALGAAPRFVVASTGVYDTTCRGGFAGARAIALPGAAR